MKKNERKDNNGNNEKKFNVSDENKMAPIDYDYRKVVPENLHELYLAIGRENYEKILDIIGGSTTYFKCRKTHNMEVLKDVVYTEYMGGALYRAIARKYGISENTVRNYVEEALEKERKYRR